MTIEEELIEDAKRDKMDQEQGRDALIDVLSIWGIGNVDICGMANTILVWHTAEVNKRLAKGKTEALREFLRDVLPEKVKVGDYDFDCTGNSDDNYNYGFDRGETFGRNDTIDIITAKAKEKGVLI